MRNYLSILANWTRTFHNILKYVHYCRWLYRTEIDVFVSDWIISTHGKCDSAFHCIKYIQILTEHCMVENDSTRSSALHQTAKLDSDSDSIEIGVGTGISIEQFSESESESESVWKQFLRNSTYVGYVITECAFRSSIWFIFHKLNKSSRCIPVSNKLLQLIFSHTLFSHRLRGKSWIDMKRRWHQSSVGLTWGDKIVRFVSYCARG
jgi:hypothetical protein